MLRRLFRAKVNSSADRAVIIHNHLFKNAGSTIDWSLRRSFGQSFIDHRDDHNMRRGADFLGPYLQRNTGLKALSTHHLVLPLPVLNNVSILMILMLRHPVERVLSVYNFERKQKKYLTPGAIHAQKYSLRKYVEWRMRPDVGATIRNFQTVRCMHAHDHTFKKKITEEGYRRAVRTLHSTKLLGLVERFDESVVMFEENLKPVFPEIDLSYRIQNVGSSRDDVPEKRRVDLVREEVGEATFERLLENNSWDLKLYDEAGRIIADRLSKISDFNGKLVRFRERCHRLQT